MKFLFTILALVLLMAFTIPSIAQINWTKYDGNPILEVGLDGSWNDAGYGSGDVLFDGETYHGWIGGTRDGEKYQIGYFTSSDGINWTEYEGNPVLEAGEEGNWDDQSVYGAEVLWDGETYHMWYTGSADNFKYGIGYATSPDGTTWTRHAGNPVLDEGAVGSWEEDGVLNPCVILEEATYHMWYEGANWPRTNIGYATSIDRVSWARHENNPILTGSSGDWDYPLIESPSVYFDGTVYHMWYTGGAGTYDWSMGYAFSKDGLSWTKFYDNPVLKRGETGEWDDQYAGFGTVVADTVNHLYKMWYGGGTEDVKVFVGFATAPLIINVPNDFETIQAAIDAANDGNVVLVDEGTYYENINYKGKAITVASQYYMDGDTSHISNTIIDGSQPSNPDSGSVVYLISGEDTTSVLIGFTITNGSGTKGQYTYGGVKYDSRDGGGIACWNSGGRFVSNKIVSNTIYSETEAFGGGVAAGDFGSTAWVILEQNHIINNTVNGLNGGFGGGVGLTCNGKLIDNIISYNSCYATEDWTAGGGVYLGTESSEPRTVFIEENDINHNLVQGNGTQPTYYWSALGGGIYNDHCKILILENEISNNKLTDIGTGNGSGGGIYTWLAGEGSVISGNTISNNLNEVTDTKYGGGISLASNDVPVYNNIVTGNSASHGGGIYCTYSDPEIINNTIGNNTASLGAGGLSSNNGLPIVINSIIWGNDAGNDKQIGGTFYVRYSDVQGGYTGEGNIDTDPFFADENFNLSDTSYCVGNGKDSVNVNGVWYTSPATDYKGNVRPHSIDEYVDMGAIESPYERVIIDDISVSDLIVPIKFELLQNYPNPFNPVTMINYQLPMTNDVNLSIYNLLGQKVAILVNERQKAGKYQVEWDASQLASGVYYYRLDAGEFQDVKKMILLR